MRPETIKGVGTIPFMSGNETLMQTVELVDSLWLWHTVWGEYVQRQNVTDTVVGVKPRIP